jgi:hypothetical protein
MRAAILQPNLHRKSPEHCLEPHRTHEPPREGALSSCTSRGRAPRSSSPRLLQHRYDRAESRRLGGSSSQPARSFAALNWRAPHTGRRSPEALKLFETTAAPERPREARKPAALLSSRQRTSARKARYKIRKHGRSLAAHDEQAREKSPKEDERRGGRGRPRRCRRGRAAGSDRGVPGRGAEAETRDRGGQVLQERITGTMRRLRLATGPRLLRKCTQIGRPRGLLRPHRAVPYPERAGVLRSGDADDGAQFPESRPGPAVEGRLAVVRRKSLGLLQGFEGGAVGRDFVGRVRVSRGVQRVVL